MPRIVWFLPMLSALLLAVVLIALGQHHPALRALGTAVVMVALVSGRYAQRRAPPPRHGLSMPLAAAAIGAIAIITLLVMVVMPLVTH
jgi:hypothetical protein